MLYREVTKFTTSPVLDQNCIFKTQSASFKLKQTFMTFDVT